MRIRMMLMLMLGSISTLTACSTNAIPQTGPTMEQVYDGMGAKSQSMAVSSGPKQAALPHAEDNTVERNSVPKEAVARDFHKLPNPALKMYVYPHLAGKEEIPIPGYFTEFNAYEHDYYALPNETIRG